MKNSDRLLPRYALVTSAERLADRFLFTGSFPANTEPIDSDTVLLYSLEVTRPWFPSSRLVPTITNVLAQRFSTLRRSANPLKSFEATLKNINEELYALTEQGETEWLGHLNAILALVTTDEVHLAQTGHSSAYLFRQRKISQITDESQATAEPHPLNTFSNIISGTVTAGDRLALANQDFYSLVSLDQIRAAVTDQTPWLAVNQLAKSLRRSKITTVSAIILAAEVEPTWKEAGPEPTTINIEESFQSWPKMVWHKTKPYLKKAGEISRHVWHLTKVNAQKAKEKWQSSYGPKTKAALSRGLSSVSAVAGQAAQSTSEVWGKAQKTVGDKIGPQSPRLQMADDWLGQQLSPIRQLLKPLKSPLNNLDAAVGRGFSFLKPYVTGKNLRYVLLTLAAILIITSLLSVRQRQNVKLTNQRQTANDQLLSQVQELAGKTDTALQLKQNVEAQNLLKQAQETLARVASPTADQQKTLTSLEKIIEEKSDKLTNTARLTAGVTYQAVDKADLIATSDKGLYTFSTKLSQGQFQTRALVDSKESFNLENNKPQSAYYDRDRDEALVLTNNKQIYGVRKEADKLTVTKKQNPLGDFAEAQYIATFTSNLYLLDPKSGLLWKYLPSGDNYNRGINQVEPTDINLTGAKGLAVDGYIYVLLKDGSLTKLLRGKPEGGFGIKGLPATNDQKNFVGIATSENTDSIFVLEKDGSANATDPIRVVVFDKAGNYLRQYAFTENLKDYTGFTVDPVNKLIWVLSGTTVYEYHF